MNKGREGITAKNIRANIPTLRTSAVDVYSWRERAQGEEYVKDMCEALMHWAQQPNSIYIGAFCRQWKIPRRTFDDYTNRWDILKRVRDEVHDIIGQRREEMAIFKKNNCDAHILMKTMRVYHPDYRQVWQEDLEAKKQLNQNTQEPVEVLIRTYTDDQCK